MAYLRRVPRSPYWIAGYNRPDGRPTQRSTKATDRKKAMKIALQWEEAARRKLTEAQFRRVLSDIHEEIHGAPLVSHTLIEYAEQWLARKKGETSAVTLSAYTHATDSFQQFLGDKASQPIHYVTPSAIAAWRDASAARASARTANNKLKIIRVFFQAAWRDGLLTENPAAKVQILKTAESSRRPFAIAEIKALLRVATEEWRGMVLAGLYTGQRLKDVALLTWANVDMERGEIALKTSKTGRFQAIPIAKPLRAYLADLPAGDDPTAPVFPEAYRVASENNNVSELSREFHELLVSAGLLKTEAPVTHKTTGKGRNATRERHRISFHSLRHTATSMLKAAGVSEAVARDIIGHESAEISRHYTHVDDEAKRSAIEKLPNIFKP